MILVDFTGLLQIIFIIGMSYFGIHFLKAFVEMIIEERNSNRRWKKHHEEMLKR